jgi:hypothetical protein
MSDFNVKHHWIIARPSRTSQFHYTDVFLRVMNDGSGRYVTMFTDEGIAAAFAVELGERLGMNGVEATLVEPADAMTDLLSRLKDEGATHVSIDPEPGRDNLTSIDVAILLFQVAG